MENKKFDKLQNFVKCAGGMSPAAVYQCKLDSQSVFLKTIHKKFANTTYSVKREAEVMNWCSGKLNVPAVIEYGERNELEYLIMTKIEGQHIDEFIKIPELYVSYLAEAILLLQSVDVSNCPFSSHLDFRLKELNYLLQNNLADIDMSHWQETTAFTDSNELYKWLAENKPADEPVFSHGDIGANLFIRDGEIYFYDLARMGIADKWIDIALAVRDIREYCPDCEALFFEKLDVVPDYKKIDYYILLDEMF